jgi:hypothetical protein
MGAGAIIMAIIGAVVFFGGAFFGLAKMKKPEK